MIQGKNIVLRMFREQDIERYLEITNDLSNMTRYWPAHLQSETKMRKELAENGFWKDDYKLMLMTDKEGQLVGEIDTFKTSPNIQGVEIGYRIFQKKNMGKGFTTEALRLFSAYLFSTMPTTPRLTLMIRSDNAGSIRVAEKCGYKNEGTLRNAWIDNGEPYTMEVYSLLRDECPRLEDLI